MLDIGMLEDDGHMVDFVQVPVDAHWRLITLAREQRLHQIARMEDYYQDVCDSPSDGRDLLRELDSAATHVDHDEELTRLIQSVARIVRSAVGRGRGVSAIADQRPGPRASPVDRREKRWAARLRQCHRRGRLDRTFEASSRKRAPWSEKVGPMKMTAACLWGRVRRCFESDDGCFPAIQIERLSAAEVLAALECREVSVLHVQDMASEELCVDRAAITALAGRDVLEVHTCSG